jgi:hypothetical protein
MSRPEGLGVLLTNRGCRETRERGDSGSRAIAQLHGGALSPVDDGVTDDDNVDADVLEESGVERLPRVPLGRVPSGHVAVDTGRQGPGDHRVTGPDGRPGTGIAQVGWWERAQGTNVLIEREAVRTREASLELVVPSGPHEQARCGVDDQRTEASRRQRKLAPSGRQIDANAPSGGGRRGRIRAPAVEANPHDGCSAQTESQYSDTAPPRSQHANDLPFDEPTDVLDAISHFRGLWGGSSVISIDP